jgi:hypothetical protein
MLRTSAQSIFGGITCGEKDFLEDLDADVTIVLKRIVMEWDWRTWSGWMWLRTEKK